MGTTYSPNWMQSGILCCFNLLCNVWVVLVTCVLVVSVFGIVCTVFFVLFRLFTFILICTSARTTATDRQLNCS